VHFSNGFFQSSMGTFLLSMGFSMLHSLVSTLSLSHGFTEGMLGLRDLLDMFGMGFLSFLVAVFLVRMLLDSFLGNIDFGHGVGVVSIVTVSDDNTSEESGGSDSGNEHYLF